MSKAVEDIKKLPVDQRVAELETLIARLTKQIADLEKTLSTAKEHDDIAKELRAEIKERKEELQDAEEQLETATEQARILEKEKTTKENTSSDISATLDSQTPAKPVKDTELERLLLQERAQETAQANNIQSITNSYQAAGKRDDTFNPYGTNQQGYENRGVYEQQRDEQKRKDEEQFNKSRSLMNASERAESMYHESKPYQ